MSGAATNTVEAAPGSLRAVPLLTSSESVGCWVGTCWDCAKGRLGASTTVVDCGGTPAGGAGVGRIGTGAGVGAAGCGGAACACWTGGTLGAGVGAAPHTTGARDGT